MTAARIGYLFHIDPVRVLDADPLEWSTRIAAARVIERDLTKEEG